MCFYPRVCLGKWITNNCLDRGLSQNGHSSPLRAAAPVPACQLPLSPSRTHAHTHNHTLEPVHYLYIYIYRYTFGPQTVEFEGSGRGPGVGLGVQGSGSRCLERSGPCSPVSSPVWESVSESSAGGGCRKSVWGSRVLGVPVLGGLAGGRSVPVYVLSEQRSTFAVFC